MKSLENSSVTKRSVLECPRAYFTNLDVINRIHTVEMLSYKQQDGCHGRPMAISGVNLIVRRVFQVTY